MRILIRRMHVERGTITFVDRRLEAPTLRIGRGTAQELEIADPRVALEHAEILPQADGSFVVEARTASGVWLNGAPCARSRLAFEDGLELGRFHVSVLEPEPDTDLAVLVEERTSTSRQDGERADHVLSLQDTRLSRRELAWAGALLVLASMLLIPLLLRYGASEAGTQTAVPLVPTDRVWSSGPMSSPHAYFETDCAACHVKPFERVRNESCLGCHDTSRHHVRNTKLAVAPDFADAKCTDCHREHNGAGGTLVREASLCTDCHANPGERFPGADLASVLSFSKDHPPFSPLLMQHDPARKTYQMLHLRQEPGVSLREDTGLVFPHALHLNAKGVDAPEGTRMLGCADCHVPGPGQISFEPVSMERHCADCHRLEFDPNDPSRVVPHGKPAEVAAVLRDHFAARALSGEIKALDALPLNPLRRRPGPLQAPAQRPEAARWSEQQGEQAVREVFEGRVCRYCHVVEATGDAQLPWSIAPLSLGEHALRGARFTHKPHEVTPCGDCHEAQSSKASSDVLLPGIETCRSCHGDDGRAAQVSSDCIDCHSYHVGDAPLWDPLATARKQKPRNIGTGMSKPAAFGSGS